MPTSLTQYTLSSTDSPPPKMMFTSSNTGGRQSPSTGNNNHNNNNNNMNNSHLIPSTSVNTSFLAATGAMSSMLSPPMPEDQMRRCSHDPNIEKLHKSYINNVKLTSQVLSSVSVSTENTDSIPNLTSTSHYASYNPLNLPRSTETETDDERSDVVNDIGKTKKTKFFSFQL